MRKKHIPLPDLALLEAKFDYNPNTGGLYHKGAEQDELNAIGSFSATGHKAVTICKQRYYVHRIVFYMFHRKDPAHYVIDHINGDRADNRIKNLRRCRYNTNAKNLKIKGKYVVDDDGVGRWVSGVVS